MPQNPTKITNQTARRFLLAHQGLWPPRQLKGKTGILALIKRLGCIQFDTINVVGRNADLTLQSRIHNYKDSLLNELLYTDRALIDGWDKMASLYLTEDWPAFTRRRAALAKYHQTRSPEATKAAPNILEQIRQQGPMSSIDFDDDQKVDWFWAETKLARATLETLYARGDLNVHHRVNTRRVWDLTENLLPKRLLQAKDPFPTLEAYQDWHVLRRLGSMGLASLRAGEYWHGIQETRSKELKATIKRLVERDLVIPVKITGIEKQDFYIRAVDQDTLDRVSKGRQPKAQAAFIAPLDNLIWNRKLIGDVFNFSYTWEVYKPKKDRQYGYYVLPVIYGDQFIARCEPRFDRKTNTLSLENWWWEAGVTPDEKMQTALINAFAAFAKYLKSEEVILASKLKTKLAWLLPNRL